MLFRSALLLGIMIVIQLAFWLTLTHVQSRFMTAALVPASVLIGLALAHLPRSPIRVAIILLLAGVTSTLSYRLFFQQQSGSAASFIGQTAAIRNAVPWGPINQMGDGVRIYAEGYATPFYFDVPITYHTVWDVSPLGQLIDQRGVRDALSELHRLGYSHLLIDRFMLNLWWSPGNYGYDPSITPERDRKSVV